MYFLQLVTHLMQLMIRLKSLFKLKSYLIRFPNMTVIHKLDLFDKLIEPILN